MWTDATKESPLHDWFERLASGKGLCCLYADSYVIRDATLWFWRHIDPLLHAWQHDLVVRRSMRRNQALAEAVVDLV
jgi:hypothetical protein